MNMPNFLIIGAEKAGTTALYQSLRQHPQITMSPVKEPCFFAFEGQKMDFEGPGDGWINRTAVTHLADYQALFTGRRGEITAGEASTYYMMLGEQSAGAIARHAPDMKLIVILRHPVDRAYSAFTAMISYGREPLKEFNQALTVEDQRWHSHWEPAWRYFENGCYAPRLRHYLAQFSRQQMRIYLYEDWNQDPLHVLRNICAFLGVDADVIPKTKTRHNISHLPHNDKLFRFLTAPHPLKSLGKPFIPQRLRRYLKHTLIARNWTTPPPLDQQTRTHLIKRYRRDILQVQDILGRDLKSWLEIE